MDLILCHTTVDFDALGAAVGLTRLYPGSKIVLAGGIHLTVKHFLALYRDEYPIIERRSVNPKQIRSLTIVDTQMRDRLGKLAQWLDLPHLEHITIYDHHPHANRDIRADQIYIESVGATTTLIIERLRNIDHITLSIAEATVMGLGIHVDTGSLTYSGSSYRDAIALAWLMEQGAKLSVIANYVEPGLSGKLQTLLQESLIKVKVEELSGYKLGYLLLETNVFVPGLSSLISRLMDLLETDAFLLGNLYRVKSDQLKLDLIGRSRIPNTDLNQLFLPFKGGGHNQAASLTIRVTDGIEVFNQILDQFKKQLPHPLTAKDLMSSPVRTIRPDTTIEIAQRLLLRYGHSGLVVVNSEDQLVGIISRRDLDLAIHHGFSHAPVKGYMTINLKTIHPDTALGELESIMVNYDIGRLPVVEQGQLVGIVTRTDVLRILHQTYQKKNPIICEITSEIPAVLDLLSTYLNPALYKLIQEIAIEAELRGWNLYIVGGVVRDLLLTQFLNQTSANYTDIDLVVDTTNNEATVMLGQAMKKRYPNLKIEVHGEFKTVALLWHKDQEFGSLCIDIATARTEFYPYPAANPEVEVSSIRQDLYRRDFTINALAVRLTAPGKGELLDFFGGICDLRDGLVRVLHANSFIEDPTRIYRAVRFAIRFGFELETQTKNSIIYSVQSGVYQITNQRKVPSLQTRLKTEIKYILQALYWEKALRLLSDLGALVCIHPKLELTQKLWKQIRLGDRYIALFDPSRTKLESWLVRLELLLSGLTDQERELIAQNLQLTQDSLDRLRTLDKVKEQVIKSLAVCQRPSQIFLALRSYDLLTLLLIAVLVDRVYRKLIWLYVHQLSVVKSPLNGQDLKALGYQPGPKFKEILERLLLATIDGEISDRNGAIAYLNQ